MEWYWYVLGAIAIYYVGFYRGKSDDKNTNHELGGYEVSVSVSGGEVNYFENPPEPEFYIEYCDAEGEITERQITPLWGLNNTAFKAWCHLRNDERTFRNERILRCINLNTNREIKDLKKYIGWSSH